MFEGYNAFATVDMGVIDGKTNVRAAYTIDGGEMLTASPSAIGCAGYVFKETEVWEDGEEPNYVACQLQTDVM